MRFYRPLGRISALTFDLDDTLYDNRPVILRTEREALTFVQNYHPALRSFQNEDLQRLRQAVREAEPEIYHDVTRWRFRSIEQAMLDAGLSAEEASAGAHAAMINFAKYSAAIFLIPICISFDTAEKRRYATYLILNRRFSFEF